MTIIIDTVCRELSNVIDEKGRKKLREVESNKPLKAGGLKSKVHSGSRFKSKQHISNT